MWAREILARVQVIADLYLLDRHPYFLGPSIILPTSAQAPGNIIPVYQRVPMPAPVEQALKNLRMRLGAPSVLKPTPPWRVIR